MFCIFAVAVTPERKGQLYKVTGETLEELWNELRDYPQQLDQKITIDDTDDPLSIDLLINVAAKVWDIPAFAIKFLEVTTILSVEPSSKQPSMLWEWIIKNLKN